MGEVLGGKRVQLNNNAASAKAAELNTLANSIAQRIYDVDASITNLVKVGIEGSAVATAATTYKRNRDVISGFVAQIAATAATMDAYAQTLVKVNTTSEDAASGSN